MFASRRSSQKPDEGFYAAFKQSFPGVGPGTSINESGQPVPSSTLERSDSMNEAIIDSPAITRPFENSEDANKDQDVTPKPFNDQWRLTPSLMDPNSLTFSAFANQPPGYYTPTPGGFNTFYHSSAAGDLHTPGMGMNTPLSLQNSIQGLHATDPNMNFAQFNPNMLQHTHSYHEAFAQQSHHPTQHLFAPPSHFLQHQDSGYSGLDDSPHKVTPGHEVHNMQSTQSHAMQHFDNASTIHHMPNAEKFRFHTTLNAPTAMVRHNEEIPITYLNKGQAYTMSIFDTIPPTSHPNVRLKYRTYVRVSFEDDQQRAKPGSCWQLWKEGRGSNEAHQRGGKLLAVEYVDPNQGGDEELRKSQIELEKASFDGFAVTWYPNSRTAGAPDCSISVRFNFLSTDFSHSKGVKGIPVRLCAKTELVTAVSDGSNNDAEVCFSKVKLFRDHGAERKLSNDVAHVKKSIDKMKQQIAQAESGVGHPGKRKRSGSMAKGAKPIKHKRVWSADSDTEAGKVSGEEDLHSKLVCLQDMFSSTRPVSILFLKGEPEDDPDLFPVKLSGGEELKSAPRTDTWESRQSGSESPSSLPSPSPSNVSVTPKRKFSELQQSSSTGDVQNESAVEESSMSPGRPVKVQKREHEFSKPDIFAFDVDNTYKPPVQERNLSPVACFYVRSKNADTPYYRAIYLTQRTVKDLINGIASKFEVGSHRIARVTHVNQKGLHIIVDEDVVRELPEGQDMIVEFVPIRSDQSVKNETTSTVNQGLLESDVSDMDQLIGDDLEMWLNF